MEKVFAWMKSQQNKEIERPHFRDVFEEIKWEKLHGKVSYIPLWELDDNSEEDSDRDQGIIIDQEMKQ
mgnify:CR=1 FL=1